MQHKQDIKRTLVAKAEKKQISKSEANRMYVRERNGNVEHIYRGELPFPEMSNRVTGEVLATRGQVLYLYTQDWQRGV